MPLHRIIGGDELKNRKLFAYPSVKNLYKLLLKKFLSTLAG